VTATPDNASSTRVSRPRRRIDGVLLLDKPVGVSSNGALAHVRRLFHADKAGHTGTLDPLASGLLPICLGAATRFAQFLLDAPKRYVATIRFGVATTTHDAEGAIVETRPLFFDAAALQAALASFVGPGLQTPPAHAALKYEARPYYASARKGIDVPRVARDVTIHALRLRDWTPPDATVVVECSKGTYVRVLAADLGAVLGCGAHLAALRRTGSGGFDIADAVTLDALEAMDMAARERCLRPSAVLVAHLPKARVAPDAARRFLHGGPIAADALADGTAAIFDGETLLGIADVAGGVAQPRRVVALADEEGARIPGED
jgi:tRNA pseudouridine55 synthase